MQVWQQPPVPTNSLAALLTFSISDFRGRNCCCQGTPGVLALTHRCNDWHALHSKWAWRACWSLSARTVNKNYMQIRKRWVSNVFKTLYIPHILSPFYNIKGHFREGMNKCIILCTSETSLNSYKKAQKLYISHKQMVHSKNSRKNYLFHN
jgi:hypothetical protein